MICRLLGALICASIFDVLGPRVMRWVGGSVGASGGGEASPPSHAEDFCIELHQQSQQQFQHMQNGGQAPVVNIGGQDA